MLQMSSITMVMGFADDHWMGILGMVGLYAAALLTVISMVQYLRAAWPQLSVK